MENPQRYVITGGPGFGKTSIIEELKQAGFICFNEISRGIIREQLAVNGDLLPWKNIEGFSRIVLEKRIIQYNEAQRYRVSFFDRGIPDVIAYLIKENIELPSAYIKHLEEKSYSPIIFITPPWADIFKNDNERMEDFDQACEAHYFIEKTYSDLGYQIIEVPKLSVKERVAFILQQIANRA
jgi:predicted ATPase